MQVNIYLLFHYRLKTMVRPSWFLVLLLQHVRKVQQNQEEQHLNDMISYSFILMELTCWGENRRKNINYPAS